VTVWTAVVAAVAAVGVSRLHLGVHWPTDVISGWLLGAGWLSVLLLAARWLQPDRRHRLPWGSARRPHNRISEANRPMTGTR